MQRFKRVLVCIDEDRYADLAIERGATLASSAGASMKVLHVSRETSRWRSMLGCEGCVSVGLVWQPRLRESFGVPPRDWSIPLATRVSRLSPGLEITREVLEGGYDAVVHVERGCRPRLFRATTTVQLARLCPCPLWVLRPPGFPGRERVLAAVGLDPLDRTADREIVDTALAVARLLDRTVHLLHVWDAPGIHLLAFHSRPEDLARYQCAVLRDCRQQLEALISHYRAVIPRERVHLRQGRPIDVIPRVAAELSADPIVIGTAARRGIAGFLLGNTAERIVHRSERSVLIVKSPGFVSPAAPPLAQARALTPAQVYMLS